MENKSKVWISCFADWDEAFNDLKVFSNFKSIKPSWISSNILYFLLEILIISLSKFVKYISSIVPYFFKDSVIFSKYWSLNKIYISSNLDSIFSD